MLNFKNLVFMLIILAICKFYIISYLQNMCLAPFTFNEFVIHILNNFGQVFFIYYSQIFIDQIVHEFYHLLHFFNFFNSSLVIFSLIFVLFSIAIPEICVGRDGNSSKFCFCYCSCVYVYTITVEPCIVCNLFC